MTTTRLSHALTACTLVLALAAPATAEEKKRTSEMGTRLAKAVAGVKDIRELDAAMARIAEELHRQYAMGFSPTMLDGSTNTGRPSSARVNRTVGRKLRSTVRCWLSLVS